MENNQENSVCAHVHGLGCGITSAGVGFMIICIATMKGYYPDFPGDDGH